jgi:hypothetical protein
MSNQNIQLSSRGDQSDVPARKVVYEINQKVHLSVWFWPAFWRSRPPLRSHMVEEVEAAAILVVVAISAAVVAISAGAISVVLAISLVSPGSDRFDRDSAV